jgi:hypothetical protein
MPYLLMYNQDSITVMSLIGVIVILTSLAITAITVGPAQAETGRGDDVFRVIMTIFGVDESKGDVIAVVTAKDEVARVKLFDATGPEVVPLNASEGGGHLIEYIATFPNLTINSGEVYKACIATVKDLELTCKTGQNSPATRPEFIDLSLNATGDGVQQATVEEEAEEEGNGEGEGEDEGNAVETNEVEPEEGNDVSPSVPPTD